MREQTETIERELCAELREVWNLVRREKQRGWLRRCLMMMMT